MPASIKSTSHIQSVDRALSILEFLSKYGESSVTEIAENMQVHKSTVFRLLATLELRGFVTQETDRGKYRLGLGLVHLASAVTADFELIRLAKPICEQLCNTTQETVNLGVLEQDYVLNIDQVIGTANVVTYNWVGQRNPINCTSTGKVLLAFLSEKVQRQALITSSKCTPNSHTDARELLKELQKIKETGYAFTLEELELGLNAVAAPIFDSTGKAIAAVSISGPSYRLGEAQIHEFGSLAKQAGLKISGKLGYQDR